MSNWLVDWWAQSCVDRRAMLWPDNSDAAPAVPAYPWDVHGRPSELDGKPYPLSYVNAMIRRLPTLMNLDALRRSVLDAIAGKPDIRTHYERSRAAWRDYLKAKERYLGNQDSHGSGQADRGPLDVKEARQEAEGGTAASGSGKATAPAGD